MINSTLKLLIIIILSLLSTGCLPGLVGYTRTKIIHCETTHPRFIWYSIDPEFQLIAEKKIHKLPTKEDILKVRGKPNQIITHGDIAEEWVYEEKEWCGFSVSYLPFMLPTCDAYVRISLLEGIASKVYYTGKNIYSGFLFMGTSDGRCPKN